MSWQDDQVSAEATEEENWEWKESHGQRHAWFPVPLVATACSDIPAFGVACSPAWK